MEEEDAKVEKVEMKDDAAKDDVDAEKMLRKMDEEDEDVVEHYVGGKRMAADLEKEKEKEKEEDDDEKDGNGTNEKVMKHTPSLLQGTGVYHSPRIGKEYQVSLPDPNSPELEDHSHRYALAQEAETGTNTKSENHDAHSTPHEESEKQHIDPPINEDIVKAKNDHDDS